jgi:hypothetical protein
MQAWREVNESPDRELRRAGRWLVWTPRLGTPRGRDSAALRAEAKENQTYSSKLVRSSQATPTETAKAAPRN